GRGEGVDAAAGWRAAMIRKLRVGNYSYQTERSYLNWACRFARRQGERSVLVCGDAEIGAFLDELAVKGAVSAGTQRQALNALVFLFREALRKELGDFSDYLRAKTKSRLPVVLSRGETQGLLAAMEGKHALMARVMYGSGLRLTELLRLRVKDVGLERRQLIVRFGKGGQGSGDAARVAAFLCDAFIGNRDGYSDGAGFARAQGCFDDADLHACDGEARDGCERVGPGIREFHLSISRFPFLTQFQGADE
ncbi:MAG: integrase, partial [Candidatus Binatia bacterium]